LESQGRATKTDPTYDDGLFGDEKGMEPCVYCGVPAQGEDHVIPQSYMAAMSDVMSPLDITLRAWGHTVPCCQQCNSMLGASALHTVAQRKSLVKERLRHKYARELAVPEWTQEEINALNGRLREHVVAAQARKVLIMRRLRW
jgi:hypothetical protein